jgi:2-aminoadipate transaminase
MLQAFDESMPRDVHWTRPEGGYFLWLELPQRLRASELMKRAAATGVALVPGSGFYAGSGGDHAARLSYSFPPVEAVRRGAEQLAALVER